MEMANILLKNLRDIKTTQIHKRPTPSTSSTSSSTTLVSQPQFPPSQIEKLLPPREAPLPPQMSQIPPARPAPPPMEQRPDPRLDPRADPRFASTPPVAPGQIFPQQPPLDNQGRPGPGGSRPMPTPPAPPAHRPSYEHKRNESFGPVSLSRSESANKPSLPLRRIGKQHLQHRLLSLLELAATTPMSQLLDKLFVLHRFRLLGNARLA